MSKISTVPKMKYNNCDSPGYTADDRNISHCRIVSFVMVLLVVDSFTISSMIIGYNQVASDFLLISAIVNAVLTFSILLNATCVIFECCGSEILFLTITLRFIVGFVFFVSFLVFFCVLTSWQHQSSLIFALVSQICTLVGFSMKMLSILLSE